MVLLESKRPSISKFTILPWLRVLIKITEWEYLKFPSKRPALFHKKLGLQENSSYLKPLSNKKLKLVKFWKRARSRLKLRSQSSLSTDSKSRRRSQLSNPKTSREEFLLPLVSLFLGLKVEKAVEKHPRSEANPLLGKKMSAATTNK